MNPAEKEMTNALIELKEHYFAVGIKAGYEDEGTSYEDLVLLKNVADNANLNLSLKTGGCGALRDIYDAERIGISAIVAPMIESVYALKKYVKTIKLAIPEQKTKNMKFYINIETKNGLKYLDEILDCEDSKFLNGVILGRTDLIESLGINESSTNSEIILNIAKETATKVHCHSKEFIIGGGVSPLSIPFFRELPENHLTRYETRKVIFDAQKALTGKDAECGIKKALEFELLWLKNKKECHSITTEETKRINILESRIHQYLF